MFGFLARVLRVYRGHWFVTTVVLTMMFTGQLIGMFRPALIGKMIDGLNAAVTAGDHDIGVLVPTMLLFVGTFPLGIALRTVREEIEIWKLDFEIKRAVERQTLERLFRFSPGQHTNENSGLKMSVINKGQHALESLAFLLVYDGSVLVLETTVLTAALFVTDWRSGGVILAGLVTYVAGTVLVNRPIIPKLRENERNFHRHGKFYSEIIRHLPLEQYFASEGRMIKESEESIVRVHEYVKPMWGRYILQFALVRAAILPTTLLLFTLMLFQSALNGRITLGVSATMFWWGLSVMLRIESFAPIQRRYLSMRAAIEKYFDMLDMEPDVKDPEEPIEPVAIRGKIEFRDVRFVYESRTAATAEDDEVHRPLRRQDSLKGVSFVIRPGEKVAIVGPSGAGKSTVIKLLLRGMDVTCGAVLIDDIDIRDLRLERLRGCIGLVDQDVSLFDHTLRYNMSLGLDSVAMASERELDHVADLSRVAEFWDRMEHGYDTVIGERGIQLSGGQRQRVGIARAIMGEPVILVFDEATSSLDAENEQAIANALDDIAEGRTTIIIAHRFSTIKWAEKVIVMDDGRVVDIGTHEQLEGRCDVYRRLLENQRL